MTDLSNYAENKLLDHLLGIATFTKPTAVYLAAFTAISDAEGGVGTEVSGGSYARVSITSLMTAAAGGRSWNGSIINFPTATGSWGTPTHFGVFDAASAGNPLSALKARVGTPAAIGSGQTLSIPIGDFDFQLTGDLTTYARNKLLDHLLGKTAYSLPFPYLWLYSAVQDALNGVGTPIKGIGVSNYFPYDINGDFSAASGGLSANTLAVLFGAASADWGTVTHIALADGTSANSLALTQPKALSPSRTILNGDSLNFPIGDLDFAIA